MKPQTRLLLALVACLAILGLSLVRRDSTARTLAASYTGTVAIDGPVRLELAVSPPVGTPRDTLQLQLRLANRTTSFASPQVQVQLPSTLRVGPGQLPTGVTSNVSANVIQWLPLVPPEGGISEVTLPLEVSSADLSHPEQHLTVILRTPEVESAASTTLWIGVPPQVTQFENPSHVSVGQPLQLKAHVQGPGPTSETWELGDGRRVAVQAPTVVYPVAGVYEVTVTVNNPLGKTSYSSPITVVPHVSARFAPEDETPGIGQTVTFANTGGGQGPVNYRWDFGDGSISTEKQPVHTFGAPGTYNVRLIAENAFGVVETSQTVTVGVPPEAEIVVAESAPAGERLTGEVMAVNVAAANTNYTWQMGDGRQYDSAKISHTYRQTGDYFITLTASNEFGETQIGRWIHVEEGILHSYMPLISYFGGLAQGSSAELDPQRASALPEVVGLNEPFVMEPIEFSAATSSIDRLLAYINEARRQFGLSALTVSPDLSAAAQKHTQDMAAARHNQHTGSDGSVPAERFIQFGYARGYAGEATAWGFADPRQSVEFWVNSPGHRPIILNPYASEVGLGYTVDYTAPSVWYWTAEFGNVSAQPADPTMRLQAPASGLETLNSSTIRFVWNWPASLAASDQFTVYLVGPGGPRAIGTTNQAMLDTQYAVEFKPADLPGVSGDYQWQVKLESSRGAEYASSELRSITINIDPNLPTPTPVPTVTPTPAPTILPTATPTATPTLPAPTPRPTEPPLPPLVVATPMPTQP